MTIAAWLSACIRFVAVVAAAQLLLHVIGTNLYELQKTKRQRELAKHPHARRLRMSPLISVTVVAHNDESTITKCLTSLMSSTYRKYEVVVIDNASRDRTRQMVNEFKAGHPNRPIGLLAKRVVARRLEAARAGYRKFGTGEIVFVISADQTVDKWALSLAAKRFKADPELQALTPKVRTASAFSALGVLQKYRELAGYRTLKWNSALRMDYEVQSTIACRRDYILSARRPQQAKKQFADEVIINNAAPATLDELAAKVFGVAASRVRAFVACRRVQLRLSSAHDLFLGWIRLPLALFSGIAALLLPFLLGYVGYLAVVLHEPTVLISIATVVSLLMAFAIWDDRQLQFNQKLAYTLGIPLAFGPLVALTVVQASAIVSAGFTPRVESSD